jgi:hypothetical protein
LPALLWGESGRYGEMIDLSGDSASLLDGADDTAGLLYSRDTITGPRRNGRATEPAVPRVSYRRITGKSMREL